ncbi:DNA-directed RNA polymerase subunit B'' [Candidatus Woesearchaeota archaeon CG_4_10_14_0_2_um_filter_57_5]|nr:MAG: hypothetical protein AUJ68_00240 [Candidatus Woesearchaeota archaeon CG1_02_57_44]PIZ53872.1 MAG: DNA-directed RNA polymerase subunit B'' [Candidatus Woesearchaeota archaeon CG_4_10_14_0_2_um_filter_57_5]
MKQSTILLEQFFRDHSIINSNIQSFNHFVDHEMQAIIEENREIEPTIIPQNVDEFKIRLDEIWVSRPGLNRPEEAGPSGPSITEADGSKRPIYPVEARLRKMTYASPIFMKVSSHINGVQRESFTTQVGNLPVMIKSKNCHLHGLNRDELIAKGEDPDEVGGYFIINGSEKVLISLEDLCQNRFMVEETSTGISQFVGKMFSERGSFKIPHVLEKAKDVVFYLSFTRVKRIPVIVIIKALGMTTDEDLMKAVSEERQFDEVIVNLMEFADIKSEDDAVDWIAKKIGITQSKDIRVERMREILDKYLLPHLGTEAEGRLIKAHNLCKMLRKYIMVSNREVPLDDKDHYQNKRLKLSGDLLGDLFRMNLKVLIHDMLYNFQRIVKRGKFPSVKVVIRDKLLTQRIYSAMATGSWVGGRKGIAQRIQRLNNLDTLSHLQRVVSPLSASQENFAARELHATHLGRLCPIETPEGTNIGLRKNLALLASITEGADEEEVYNHLRALGLRPYL